MIGMRIFKGFANWVEMLEEAGADINTVRFESLIDMIEYNAVHGGKSYSEMTYDEIIDMLKEWYGIPDNWYDIEDPEEGVVTYENL